MLERGLYFSVQGRYCITTDNLYSMELTVFIGQGSSYHACQVCVFTNIFSRDLSLKMQLCFNLRTEGLEGTLMDH